MGKFLPAYYHKVIVNKAFKCFSALAFILSLALSASAQNGSVGIGTNAPKPNAILDIDSKDKGLLIPRLTVQQSEDLKIKLSPAGESNTEYNGMLIYINDDVDLGIQTLKIWKENNWVEISGSAGTPGADGINGTNGADGQSALDLWLSLPENAGKSPADFLTSIQGKSAYEIWVSLPENNGKTETEFLASLKGADGLGYTNATVDGEGNLLLTNTEGNTISAGYVRGAQWYSGPLDPPELATEDAGVKIDDLYLNNTKGDVYKRDANGWYFLTSLTTGVTGPTGPEGPTGPVGVDGAIGATGPQGPAGADGVAGPAGANGANGATGPAGAVGPTGPAGPKGDTGPAGSPGAIGPQGPLGLQGPIGLTGAAGATGLPGVKGEIGDTGPQGSQGPVGATGATGAIGTPGLAGAKGDTGAQGATGTGVASAAVSGSGVLSLGLSDGSTVTATGNVNSSAWALTGNSNIPNGAFLGTTTGEDLLIKTNDAQRLVIKGSGPHEGFIGIGINDPKAFLHANTLNVGPLEFPINQIIKMSNVGLDANVNITTGNGAKVRLTVGGASPNGSVIVSPTTTLAPGIIITYARVVETSNSVEIGLYNLSGASFSSAGLKFNVTVIQ